MKNILFYFHSLTVKFTISKKFYEILRILYQMVWYEFQILIHHDSHSHNPEVHWKWMITFRGKVLKIKMKSGRRSRIWPNQQQISRHSLLVSRQSSVFILWSLFWTNPTKVVHFCKLTATKRSSYDSGSSCELWTSFFVYVQDSAWLAYVTNSFMFAT